MDTYDRQREELYSMADNVELETRPTALEDDPLALVGEIVHALRQEFESGDNLLRQRMRGLEQQVTELREQLSVLIK
jgi:HEAT repeat protein